MNRDDGVIEEGHPGCTLWHRMAAMLLVILHGGKDQVGKIPAIQIEFDDALPQRQTQHPNPPVFE